jgi:hypothetical protein
MKFQKDFLDKFVEETTTGALMAELFATTTIFKKFHPEAKTTQELQIEVYANALLYFISMFVKRDSKATLAENFEEAKMMEFKMK